MLNSVSTETGSSFWSSVVEKLPIAAGLYVFTAGFLALAGWTFGLYRLIDWNNTGITMKANAAICAALLGAALVLSTKAARHKLLIRILASASALISALTLLEHLLGVNFGIDTLLFDEPAGAPATAAPGRMGVPASTTFTLTAVALILGTSTTRMRRGAGWLGVAVLTVSSLPLLGYLYGASQLYSFSRLTGIAFQTATVIALLGIGVIAAMREFGLVSLIEGETTGAMMFRRLALPLVLVSVVIGWLRVSGQNLGLYDTAFGTAARTLVEILVVIGLLWWTARGLNQAEEKLRDADPPGRSHRHPGEPVTTNLSNFWSFPTPSDYNNLSRTHC